MEKMEGVFVASCHGKGVAESEEVKLEVVGLNEAWRYLGGEGVRWLTNLFNKSLLRAKISEEWRLGESIPWCLIFADDIVLVLDTPEGLNERLKKWREMLEEKGLRVSKEKTKYLRCDFNWNENDRNKEAEIRIGEPILEMNESFRYLGSVIHKFGRKEDDVTHCIQAGWLKWRVPLTKVQANRMEVVEMRMLRWTCGKTILDMIPNGAFRRNLQVATIVNKMREGRLRWFGHVKRRPQSALVRRVESITVDGVRRSRPKLR
ncbi:retrovirus-related pol polyprotein LINE-1 [Tanacetum coccineum]|uniref:Retrovirus-related pol polyprotein LINE-1 n=1 Tax=Tanacetum coccineum TaxID=301880 RepID=A0ABQ5CY80_9ASTR